MTEVATERARLTGISLVALLAVGIAFRNLAGASFTGDDWHFLALLRHIDSPWDIFTSNIAASYFHRPVALSLFWLTVDMLGTNAMTHYAVNLALHGWVAIEVCAFATLLSANRRTSMWIAAVFLVYPATAATPLWISDRFDLLATALMLCSLRFMAQFLLQTAARRGRWLLSITAATLALGSKEIAFALIPSLLLLLTLCKKKPARQRLMLAGTILLVAALMLLNRRFALGQWAGHTTDGIKVATVVGGVALWLVRLPEVLQTHGGLKALAVVAAGGLLGWLVTRFAPKRTFVAAPNAPHTVLILLALALLAAGVIASQSPVVVDVLSAKNVSLVTVSLRFFYAPLAIAFIVLAVALASIDANITARVMVHNASTFWPQQIYLWLWQFSLLSAVLVGASGSAQQTHLWADHTRSEKSQAAAALDEYARAANSQMGNRPCLVTLQATASALTDLDLRFKANLPTSDPRINCSLLTQPPQVQTLTRIDDCRAHTMLPASSSVVALEPLRRSGTCTYFFLTRH